MAALSAAASADDGLWPPRSPMLPAVPAAASPVEPGPVRGVENCEVGMYLQPMIFGSTQAGHYIHRMSLGMMQRDCNGDRTSAIHYKLGFSGYIADEEAGFGGELEVVVPLAARVRLGSRVSVESSDRWGKVFTAGPRLTLADTLIFGADVFYITQSDNGSPAERTAPFGLTLGFGFAGDAGSIVGATELLLAAALFVATIGRGGTD